MNLLTLTSRAGVDRVYGAGAYQRLLPVLDEHAQARVVQGDTRRLVPDDPQSAALWGMPVEHVSDAGALARAVRRAHAREQFDAVLIVGGPEVVPHASFRNLVDRDENAMIPSDNVYGASDEMPGRDIVPDLAVGRAIGADFAALTGHLAAMTRLHRQPPTGQGAAAVACEVWSQTTSQVAATIGAVGVQTAPVFTAGPTTLGTFAVRRLLVNLHGFEQQPGWEGQGIGNRTVLSITPDALANAEMTGTVVFATNCYGAHISGKSARTSCAMRMSERGARAVVGATNFAYGAASSSVGKVQFADRLAQLFFAEHVTGATAGEALTRARRRYVKETLTPHGVLPPHEQKTALQFILLGDPTL